MAFCKKCRSLLVFREGLPTCPRCGVASRSPGDHSVVTAEIEEREMLVLEEGGTLPKTRIECSKCGHKEAYWMIRQTRAADEPETRIYRCAKCAHTWREY